MSRRNPRPRTSGFPESLSKADLPQTTNCRHEVAYGETSRAVQARLVKVCQNWRSSPSGSFTTLQRVFSSITERVVAS